MPWAGFLSKLNSIPALLKKYAGFPQNDPFATEGLQRFIDKAKKVTQLTELTPELVHEFIQKIVVGKPEYRDNKRYQSVEIYHNGVGIIREPSPKEMEEYLQKHLAKRGQRNAAQLESYAALKQ